MSNALKAAAPAACLTWGAAGAATPRDTLVTARDIGTILSLDPRAGRGAEPAGAAAPGEQP